MITIIGTTKSANVIHMMPVIASTCISTTKPAIRVTACSNIVTISPVARSVTHVTLGARLA